MNATFRDLSALAIAFSMSIATSSAYSQGAGKSKAKGKLDVDARGNNGRKAGELPFGLDEDGNRLMSTGKGKKRAK